MRCCALLRGICVLEDSCLHALTGILERQNWETWLVSQYILLGGDGAIDRLKSDYVKNTTTLQRELGLGSKYTRDWEGDAQRLISCQLAQKLQALLVKAGDTEGVDLVSGAYDRIYRVQSQFAVHTGLSTLWRYSSIEGEWVSVEPSPPSPLPNVGNISLRCTLHHTLPSTSSSALESQPTNLNRSGTESTRTATRIPLSGETRNRACSSESIADPRHLRLGRARRAAPAKQHARARPAA